MDTGRWLMIGLIVAGGFFMLAALPLVLRRMNRVRARLEELEQSRLMHALDGLQREGVRFQALSKRTQPVVQRAQKAVGSIQASLAEAQQLPGRDALANAGSEMAALLEDLR